MDGCDERHDSDLAFASDYLLPMRHIQLQGRGKDAKQLTFSIPQSMNNICSMLWPSSLVLAEVVATELRDTCGQGCNILELGCGSALPSMVAACLGAKAVATDLDVSSAEAAMAQNQSVLDDAAGSISLDHLLWGCKEGARPADVVLVADAIYTEKTLRPLATTLAALASGSKSTPRILMAYQLRDPAMEKYFFGQILTNEALSYRELSLDGIPNLPQPLREYIKVVDIYPSGVNSSCVEPGTMAG